MSFFLCDRDWDSEGGTRERDPTPGARALAVWIISAAELKVGHSIAANSSGCGEEEEEEEEEEDDGAARVEDEHKLYILRVVVMMSYQKEEIRVLFHLLDKLGPS